MMSQVTNDQGKELPGILPKSEFDYFSYEFQHSLDLSATVEENLQENPIYNAFYTNNSIMNAKQSLNNSESSRPTSLQWSMNPNAHHFVPRLVFEQGSQQVSFRIIF